MSNTCPFREAGRRAGADSSAGGLSCRSAIKYAVKVEAIRTALDDAWFGYQAAATAADRKPWAQSATEAWVAWIESGGDLNAPAQTRYLSKAPLWFASLCTIELAQNKGWNLAPRRKLIEVAWNALDANQIALGTIADRCLSCLAAQRQHLAVVEKLLPLDPHLAASDLSVFVPLTVRGGQPSRTKSALSLMELAAQYDPDVDRPSRLRGITALMGSAAETNVEQCRWLLERGADVNRPDTNVGATPWMHALSPRFGIGDFGSRRRIDDVWPLLEAAGADLSLEPETGETFDELARACRPLTVALTPSPVAAPRRASAPAWVDAITGDDIRALHRDTDFLLFPEEQMLVSLLQYLGGRGIEEVDAAGVAKLLGPKFNGVPNDTKRATTAKRVGARLHRMAVRGVEELILSPQGDDRYQLVLRVPEGLGYRDP